MAAGKPTSYTMNRRLAAAKSKEFSIVDKFALGYRNREDVTTLPPGVLIEGSQNVLTNTFQRVGVRKGYTLDGAANSADAPIGGGGTGMGVFDWVTSSGAERNMRAGFLTSAGNDGKLQFRHVKADGTIQWLDLLTGLTSVNFNFITFFDPTKLQTVLLMVNGEANIRSWTGGASDLTSGSSNPTGIIGLVAQPGGDTSGRVSGGKNFVVGDILSISGGGNDATIRVVTVDASFGQIATASVNVGGTLWSNGDQFTVTDNNSNQSALCQVTNNAAGVVTAFTILNPGFDFSVTSGFVCTATSGTGTGLTINVDSTTNGGIESWAFASDADHGSGYSSNTKYTLTGGSGTLAYIYVDTIKSASITKAGTETWAQAGFIFQAAGTGSLLINGVTYTYDSADFLGDTTTIYGISPDPSGIVSGDLAIQSVVTTANAGGSTGLPTTFANQLIGTIYGRVLVGSSSESYIYVSDVTTPSTQAWTAWQPGTFFLSTNNPPTAFVSQDEQLYISVGTSQWFLVQQNISSTLTTTALSINPVNTAPLQSAQSQAMTTKISNSIAFVSFEPAIQSFGPVQNIFLGPQMVDFSYAIVNLMNDYDFTGGSVAYYRKFLYIAVPRENVVLIYNMTNPKDAYWEAPQILPIARFSIIGGELYGHSSQVSETYKLFTGYADRATSTSIGNPISAKWRFSFENYGSRFSFKKATKAFVEGYISPNATLTMQLTYELDACKTVKTFTLDGDDDQFVCLSPAEGSLGKESLGKVKLGGDAVASINGLPPKFRYFPTFSNTDFFECSVSFSVLGTNSQTEILAFGLATGGSSEIPVQNYD